jgi:DNA helicase-2/ATP-dependent DNA helicase PcrA
LEPNKSLNSNAEYAEEKITLLKYNSEVEESIGVVKKIKELISSGVSPLEIAVLARNNKQLANIAEYFEDNEIPFSLSVSKNVLENPYTKKVISILKVLDDPSNFVELNKVFFLPNLKISVKEILAFNDYVKSNNLKNCFEVPYSEGKGEISALLRMLDKWYKSSELLSVPELIIEIITDIKLIEYLVLKLEKIEDFESLNSFIDFAKASHVNGRANSVAEILNTLDSMLADNLSPRAKEILPSAESVQLMSAHKSKGLEFDYVFMIATINSKWTGGAKHNSFIPKGLLSPMYDSKKDEEEESRRLFYVGLTRAKKSVFLTYASDYTATTSEQIAAKFITEIDENLISVETVSPISHKELAETILKKPAEDYSFYKEKNKIQELVKNFKLSATSLNNFLGCRKRFFLQNILRIPQSTGPKLIIGNAVHVLAEKFIDKFDVKKEELVEAISMYISRQNCSDKDKKYFLEKSIEFYVNWTTAMREDNITINPLFREYKFEAKNIIFEGVPLTGKIDVVELLNEDAKEVRVYDYKTTKPKRENEIKGLNKGSNANYYNQLMFYKLMSESVPNFKYKVVQGAIAFIEPDANNEYKTVNINFNDQDYAEFKETVTTVYEQIQNLEFLDFTEECTCLNCEYNYL